MYIFYKAILKLFEPFYDGCCIAVSAVSIVYLLLKNNLSSKDKDKKLKKKLEPTKYNSYWFLRIKCFETRSSALNLRKKTPLHKQRQIFQKTTKEFQPGKKRLIPT